MDELNMRVCDTGDLLVMNRHAKEHRLSRTLTKEVLGHLDPNGSHVLRLTLFGHNADSPTSLHHRTSVLMQFTDIAEPFEAALDVLDRDWRRLASVAEALAAGISVTE